MVDGLYNLSSSVSIISTSDTSTSSSSYWIVDSLTIPLINGEFCLGYIVVVTLLVCVSVTLNMLLMLAILKSPTLNTQPNSFLVSICANGILVSVAACLEVANLSLIYKNAAEPHSITAPELSNTASTRSSQVLTAAHNVVLNLTIISYLLMFLVVSYYKSCVAEDRYMSYPVRRALVIKLLVACWSCSTLTSLLYCVIWLLDDCVVTNYPATFLYNIQELLIVACSQSRLVYDFALVVLILHYALAAIATILIVITLRSVINLRNMFPTTRGSRVTPQIDSSPASGMTSPAASSASTAWTCGDNTSHTFNCGAFQPNIYALDNGASFASEISSSSSGPSQLFSITKSGQIDHLHQQQPCVGNSNINNADTSFTDLSKERCSSTDLLSDSHANVPSKYASGLGKVNTSIRNILAMLIMFFLCSMPALVISIPHATSQLPAATRIHVTLVVKTIFYLNSIAYPIWYFTFTQKVRKMLQFNCDN